MVKRHTMLTLVAFSLLILLSPVVQAVDYPTLIESKSKSILPVKFTVKMTVSRQGKSKTRNISSQVNGVLVNQDGLLLMSASQLKGPVMFKQSNRRRISFETVARNFKVRGPDGSWLEAELKARDSGLDLAFLKVTEPLDDHGEVNPVTFPEEEQNLTVGEEVTHISRFREGLNFEPHLLVTRISGTIEEPRFRYSLMDGAGMLANYIGSPAFTADGTFVGMATFRTSGRGGTGSQGTGGNPFASMSRNQQFLLPAPRIRKAVRNFQSG